MESNWVRKWSTNVSLKMQIGNWKYSSICWGVLAAVERSSITCKVNTLMPADVINNILCDITLSLSHSHSLTSEQIERIVQQPVKLIKINCFTNFVDTDLSTYHICVVISSITQQGSNHSHKAQCVCVYISVCVY